MQNGAPSNQFLPRNTQQSEIKKGSPEDQCHCSLATDTTSSKTMNDTDSQQYCHNKPLRLNLPKRWGTITRQVQYRPLLTHPSGKSMEQIETFYLVDIDERAIVLPVSQSGAQPPPCLAAKGTNMKCRPKLAGSQQANKEMTLPPLLWLPCKFQDSKILERSKTVRSPPTPGLGSL